MTDALEVFPAIDLRGGRCVRLYQGAFDAETVYGDDPVRVAREFEAAGARWIHVVDLDAARSGVRAHLEHIAAVARAVSCHVQAGGGVRSRDAAQQLLDVGVARVVVGTAAVEHPELVDELCAAFPDRVAVGLDARGREVATRGWTVGGGGDLLAVAERCARSGAAALVVTSIGRDGTMEGPDLEQLGAVLDATAVPVVASGGVGTLDDLRALAGLRSGTRGLAGVIVGRALYDRRFTVADALTVAG